MSIYIAHLHKEREARGDITIENFSNAINKIINRMTENLPENVRFRGYVRIQQEGFIGKQTILFIK